MSRSDLDQEHTVVKQPNEIEDDNSQLAQDIAQVYQDQYVNYPFEIDDPEHVEEKWIPSDHEVFVVKTGDGKVSFKDGKPDVRLKKPEIVGTGAVVYDNGAQVQELGRAGLKGDFVRPSERSFYTPLLKKRVNKAVENMQNEDHPAEITFTQPVLAHAATQYCNGREGFAAVGNSVKKYSEVFDPDVRASVGQMMFADSSFRNPTDRDVYFDESLRDLTDQALSNLNESRNEDLENISRTLIGESSEEYSMDDLVVKEQMYDREESGDHGLGIAIYKVSSMERLEENEEDLSEWDQGIESVGEFEDLVHQSVEDDEIKYVNVKFDSNTPQTYDLTQGLVEDDFAGEAFMPEMFRYQDGVGDLLSMQYFDGAVEAELLPEFYDIASSQPNLGVEASEINDKRNYEVKLSRN